MSSFIFLHQVVSEELKHTETDSHTAPPHTQTKSYIWVKTKVTSESLSIFDNVCNFRNVVSLNNNKKNYRSHSFF